MPKKQDINKILIIGSGPIIIGQACEFDYSGTQACKALRRLGYQIVLVNSNPATIMTDPDVADITYIEPLNVDRLTQIIEKERPDALLPNLGGQSGLNLCSELSEAGVLEKYNVQVIGVQVDAIERGEDRIEFKHTMQKLGIEMPRSEVAYSVEEAVKIAEQLKYPVVLRPAYTMGGAGGGMVYNIDELKVVCATVETLDQRIIPYIKKICKRDPFTGKVVTGGIVTVKDSSWLLSWTINRQPQFREQPKDHCLVWVYALFSDKPGDYIKKPMRECTGKEICMEWLYHLGVPENEIEDMAEHSANTVPVMMPYIDAFFMPRAIEDRPKVVPDGAVNFAFLGQFAELPRDTIFTTEYSMRTGMEAVYTLLNVDRGVPEVWGSVFDIRALLDATVKLRDGKKATDMKMNLAQELVVKKLLGKIKDTDIEKILKEYNVI